MKNRIFSILLGITLLFGSGIPCSAAAADTSVSSESIESESLYDTQNTDISDDSAATADLQGESEDVTDQEDNASDISEINTDSAVQDTEEADGNTEEKEGTSADDDSEKQNLKDMIEEKIQEIDPYYEIYFEEESVNTVKSVLEEYYALDYDTVNVEKLEDILDSLTDAVENLTYSVGDTPRVYITTEDGKGNSLVKDDGYINTKVVITDEEAASIITNDSLIKVRGNTTANGAKKPYNIKFSSKQNVLGMGKAKKWALLANCFDPTLVRNAVAFQIAADFGLEYTSEYRFCEVWMDGVYKGSYLLTELVESGSSRINIDTDGNDFILEYEKSRTESDVTYITTDAGLRFSFKEPEEPTEEQYASASEKINTFLNSIAEEDYETLLTMFDEDSFAKYFLLNSFMKTKDFDLSSVYFYYTNGKFYAGPAWDYDLSSGNASPTYVSNSSGDWAYNIYRLLWEREEFQKTVMTLFEQEKEYLQWIFCDGGLVDLLVTANRTSIDRNFTDGGWDTGYRYSRYMAVPYETYDENVAYLKQWFSSRYEWLSSNWKIKGDVSIIRQPESVYDIAGAEVNLSVQAEGDDLTYQWYYSIDAGTKWYKSSASTDSFSIRALSNFNNRLYRCVVTDAYGTKVTSENAVLHIYPAGDITILSQPVSIVPAVGDNVIFQINAIGKSLTYQWYYSVDGGEKWYKSTEQGCQSDTLSLTYRRSMSKKIYRCKIKNSAGKTAYSDVASFT